MATITESQALAVVGLVHMKDELRIPPGETSHDTLLAQQIHSAVSFVMEATGRELADLPRAAVIAAVRSQYDGAGELSPNASVFGWANPFRTIAD